ncbi:MAG: hypothetical protein JXA91_00640 [Candidatus Thermoplasmatota archaeon]|nr:hypothetical protein [Candidatus Thermoplasmatota archaeon]
MRNMKTLRVTVIICLLLIGSFLPMFNLVKTGDANPGEAEETLYFANILDIENATDSSFGIVPLSKSPPTSSEDLLYPPNILSAVSLSEEELFQWILSWGFYLYGIEGIGDLADLGEFEDLEGLSELIEPLMLLFPHPFRIVESYVNEGDESITVEGNINFRLYFSSPMIARVINLDTVKVAVYTFSETSIFPKLRAEKNQTIKPDGLLKDISVLNIELDKVNFTVSPGSTILFAVELVPSNKTIKNFISKPKPLIENATALIFDFVIGLMENSTIPSFQTISSFYREFQNISEEYGVNLSKDDIAQIANSIRSSSFVYGSNRHPSSVTIPFETSTSNEENYKNFYLKTGNSMIETKPVSQDHQSVDLATETTWSSQELVRSKILKQATAELYIDYQDFQLLNPFKKPIKVIATLLDGSTTIDAYEIELDRTTLSDYLEGKEPIEMFFPFSNLSNYEIKYGHKLDLNVKVENGTQFGLISGQSPSHRYIKLFYDSTNYPSSLRLVFSDTDHIKMDVDANPSNEKLVPGGVVHYYLNISSYGEEDTINVEMPLSFDTSKWDVEINPTETTVGKGATKTVNVNVSAKDSAEDEDIIDLKFSASGKTGLATHETSVQVSEDAVEYEIGLISPPMYKTIKHGENGTYLFKVTNENTGIWPDDYVIKVTSEHDWNLTYRENINGLMPGKSKEIEVIVSVPEYTNITSDELIFKVTSDGGKISVTANVITNVTGPDIIESLYHYFELLAKDLGFDELFGEYAPHALAAIFVAIAFFVIIIIVFLLTMKNVNIICLDRIKEISPAQSARFDIMLKNPTKKPKTYLINANPHSIPANWDISFDSNRVIVNPRQTVPLSLFVHPTHRASENEWIKVDITVQIEGKKKKEKITTMTMLKDAVSPLVIDEVYHYPRNFGEGEKVTTSFKLKNNGNIESKKVSVSILVNNEQKNKVEDIIIPAGGYADIRMPWIAVKGKNEIDIVVE